MSRREDSIRLADMLEHARLALDLAKGRPLADYTTDRHSRAAIERYVEIIGEAARHVSPGTRERFPDLPWEKIVATRNIIAHGYDLVRPDILHEIVRDHLPTLIEGVTAFLEAREE